MMYCSNTYITFIHYHQGFNHTPNLDIELNLDLDLDIELILEFDLDLDLELILNLNPISYGLFGGRLPTGGSGIRSPFLIVSTWYPK